MTIVGPDGERTVVLTSDDFAALPSERSREIEVVEFVPTEQIDLLTLDKAYYLEPDSKSPKAYVLLREEVIAEAGFAELRPFSADARAVLETLAIIAYKQPVTKGEIEAIRGVSSDYAVQKLLEKELIVISGRNEKLPGHPLLYATSKSFMDYFGINSPEDLPRIKEVLAEQIVLPTNVMEAMERSETETETNNNDKSSTAI